MLVYVDDIAIAGSSSSDVDRVVHTLSATFPIKSIFLALRLPINLMDGTEKTQVCAGPSAPRKYGELSAGYYSYVFYRQAFS
jgi:hypothetical protein